MLPRIGVVITNHDCSSYLADAIFSVANQSYSNLEVVVVDDCSRDDSATAIDRALTMINDARFSLVQLPVNLGQMGAIKAGLDRLSTPFVCCLDSDDFWLPAFVERHVQAHLNCVASAGFTASDMVIVDQVGSMVMGTVSFHARKRGDAPVNGVKSIASDYLPELSSGEIRFHAPPDLQHYDAISWAWPWVGTSAMMFRRALLDLIVPKVTEDIRINADYYLAILGQFVSGSILVGETLGCYRIHGENRFARNLLLGGDTSLADRDHSPMYQAQREVILRNLSNERSRYIQVIGVHRYERIMALLKPPPTADKKEKVVRRKRFLRW